MTGSVETRNTSVAMTDSVETRNTRVTPPLPDFGINFMLMSAPPVHYTPRLDRKDGAVFTTHTAELASFVVARGVGLVIACRDASGVRWVCDTVPSHYTGRGVVPLECGDGRTFRSVLLLRVEDAGERVVVAECRFSACVFRLSAAERVACEALVGVARTAVPPIRELLASLSLSRRRRMAAGRVQGLSWHPVCK